MERREEREEETAFVSTSGELLPVYPPLFSLLSPDFILTFSP